MWLYMIKRYRKTSKRGYKKPSKKRCNKSTKKSTKKTIKRGGLESCKRTKDMINGCIVESCTDYEKGFYNGYSKLDCVSVKSDIVWEEFYDENANAKYYFNHKTGEAEWILPDNISKSGKYVSLADKEESNLSFQRDRHLSPR